MIGSSFVHTKKAEYLCPSKAEVQIRFCTNFKEKTVMPLVTTNNMFKKAQAEHYAIPAFNVENMEMAQAVIDAAKETDSPVILQTTVSTVSYASFDLFAGIAKALASCDVEAALHLDHGDTFENAIRALRAGYTSVMIDGSSLPLEENIAAVSRVVAAASAVCIPVEAELGKVGGKEDGVEGTTTGGYTDPQEAAHFIKSTGINSLAVAIGTAHGVYSGVPKLDIERLKEINSLTDIPLVLHGASGLSIDDVRNCIENGVCKVNFATELRMAYTDAMKKLFAEKPDAFDPKAFGKAGKAAVKHVVSSWMAVCGCVGKRQ